MQLQPLVNVTKDFDRGNIKSAVAHGPPRLLSYRRIPPFQGTSDVGWLYAQVEHYFPNWRKIKEFHWLPRSADGGKPATNLLPEEAFETLAQLTGAYLREGSKTPKETTALPIAFALSHPHEGLSIIKVPLKEYPLTPAEEQRRATGEKSKTKVKCILPHKVKEDSWSPLEYTCAVQYYSAFERI